MLRALLLTLGAALFVAACGSDAMMTPPDTSLHAYTADDPNIQTASYMGRIDFTNPQQPKFSLAATTITASFMGTGVSALIKDEYRYGMFKNYYDAQIDGMPATKITMSGDPAMFEYTVATDLPYGQHTLVLAKRTEPNVGNGFFAGINVSGTILPAPARPTRKIEFMGDSITSGAGVEASGQNDPACMLDNGYALALMDANLAYDADTGRDLGADYHILGVSGIGLTRNYTSDPRNDLRPMPQVYDLLLPQLTDTSAANTWDTTKWVPDAVVVALGTNDFSPGDNPALTAPGTPATARPLMDVGAFVTAYVAFVDQLRAYYPSAHIFAMGSPMLVDDWPTAGLYKSRTDLENALTMIQDHYATAGDAKVHKVSIAKVPGTGCGTHPGVAEHQAVAATLEAAIKTALAW
jgi:lysophospholipase L1-like esterase